MNQIQKENHTYEEGLKDGYELHKKEILKLVDGYPKYIYKKDLMNELEGEWEAGLSGLTDSANTGGNSEKDFVDIVGDHYRNPDDYGVLTTALGWWIWKHWIGELYDMNSLERILSADIVANRNHSLNQSSGGGQ